MSNLFRLLGRRLLAMPIMVLGVTLLVFFVMSLSTADPARLALGESASLEALEAYRVANGLDDPVLVRLGRYLAMLVQGDLGQSFTGVPITQMVAESFPITLQLTFIGLIIAVVFALVLGVVAALYRDQWPDQVIRVLSIAGLATPSFWLALLLIQAFSTVPGGTGTFPALVNDWIPFSQDPAGYVNQIALPAISLAIPVAGSLTRVVRTAMVEELDKDYVRTAIGAGIPKPVVIARNVLPTLLDWLAKHAVPFHEIHVGKPWPGKDGFYIDDRAVRPQEFLEHSLAELEELCRRDRVTACEVVE